MALARAALARASTPERTRVLLALYVLSPCPGRRRRPALLEELGALAGLEGARLEARVSDVCARGLAARAVVPGEPGGRAVLLTAEGAMRARAMASAKGAP